MPPLETQRRFTDGPALDPKDRASFGRFFRHHATEVTCWLRRCRVPESHREDLVQEVFMRAFEKRHTYDPGRAKPGAWLYGFTIGEARNHMRGLKRRREDAATGIVSREPSVEPRPDEALEGAQEWQVLEELVEELDEERRLIVLAKEVDEIPMADIAAAHDMPLSTVYAKHKSGMAELQKRYEARQARFGIAALPLGLGQLFQADRARPELPDEVLDRMVRRFEDWVAHGGGADPTSPKTRAHSAAPAGAATAKAAAAKAATAKAAAAASKPATAKAVATKAAALAGRMAASVAAGWPVGLVGAMLGATMTFAAMRASPTTSASVTTAPSPLAPTATAVVDVAEGIVATAPTPALPKEAASATALLRGTSGPSKVRVSAAPSASVATDAVPAASASASKPDAFLAEANGFEVARVAYTRGDTPAALEALNRHAQNFPRGQFAGEREKLWVFTLLRAGRRPEAKARLDALRARNPSSPIVAELEPYFGARLDGGD